MAQPGARSECAQAGGGWAPWRTLNLTAKNVATIRAVVLVVRVLERQLHCQLRQERWSYIRGLVTVPPSTKGTRKLARAR